MLLELIVDHRYPTGGAEDHSGNGNHGFGRVALETRDGKVGARFDGSSDRIVVPPSLTLARLGGIRVDADVWVEELGQRRTLLEGYLAFAFFVESDGSVGGTIFSGAGWGGLRSPPDVVPLGRWIRLTYVYDGRDVSALWMNGSLVAREDSPLGEVRGVEWPFGLNVGAWPDADRRVFRGLVHQVRLWRRAGW